MTQKVFRSVNNDGDIQPLQHDVDKQVIWSEKWEILTTFEKCKLLHTGHGK